VTLALSWPCWHRALRFTYDLCGVTGELKPHRASATARTLAFDCSWS
jgi:hypothetical protein